MERERDKDEVSNVFVRISKTYSLCQNCQQSLSERRPRCRE